MVRRPSIISRFVFLFSCCAAFASSERFVPILFMGNGYLQTDLRAGGSTFPLGYTTLGGVPFQLISCWKNFWCADIGDSVNPKTFSVEFALENVKTVYTLMNLYWGDPHDTTLAAIEFVGSGGALHRVPLVANVNIRDFDSRPPSYSDSIDTNFTKEVFNNKAGQRLDCQKFTLPPVFMEQNLVEIRIIDNGYAEKQRVFLYGITAGVDFQMGESYQPLSFAFNGRLQTSMAGSVGLNYPCGELNFQGVPFSIPATGDNWWHASNAGTTNPRVLEIPVNKYGVSEIFTLINTYWGVHGDSTKACVQIIGDKDSFTVSLFTGRHIRDFDYLDDVYENEIDSAITTEVYNNGNGQRLDRQRLFLPLGFLHDTLRSIRIIDKGDDGVQRIFLYGITIKYLQSPAGTISPRLHGKTVPSPWRCETFFGVDGRRITKTVAENSRAARVIIRRSGASARLTVTKLTAEQSKQ